MESVTRSFGIECTGGNPTLVVAVPAHQDVAVHTPVGPPAGRGGGEWGRSRELGGWRDGREEERGGLDALPSKANPALTHMLRMGVSFVLKSSISIGHDCILTYLVKHA